MQNPYTQELTFQSLHRPLPYQFFNTLGSSLNAVGLSTADLNTDSLLERSKQITKLTDFGDQDFYVPLAHLVESLGSEAQLNFVGQYIFRNKLVELLSERLRVQQYLKSFPETLTEKIESPLFVIGLPRSGTSFLFNLLCQAPNSLWIKYWELYTPPDEFFNGGQLDQTFVESASIKKCSQDLANIKRLVPQLDQVHSIDALGSYECFHLLERSFVCHTFGLYANVPTYLEWFESEWWEANPQNPANLYQYYHKQIQLIKNMRHRTVTTQESPEIEKHWVFKSPVHLWATDHISTAFLDACFVHIHRDPLSVIPSICSFVAMGRAALSDQVELQKIGKQVLGRWSRAINKALENRQKNSSLRIIDIHYKDFIENPIDIVRRIHHQFNYAFTTKTEENLKKYLRKPSKSGQGKHKYSLQQFGLEEGEVRKSFRNYYQFIDSIDSHYGFSR